MPEWIAKESPKTKELWAPDISLLNGEYHLYYAFSVFGKNTSGIALLTNKTLDPSSPEYHWVDRGLVLRSRAEDDFNAIDPNLVIDEKGQPWLAFGSFWSGIKMRQIDAKSGLLSSADSKLYSLASRKRPDNPGTNPPGLPGDLISCSGSLWGRSSEDRWKSAHRHQASNHQRNRRRHYIP
jgi:arabinan endo-1,5-alpha-L-arabinosidase